MDKPSRLVLAMIALMSSLVCLNLWFHWLDRRESTWIVDAKQATGLTELEVAYIAIAIRFITLHYIYIYIHDLNERSSNHCSEL